ncbi:hypothetical protein ACSMX9_15500 [Streptomyces sp. LE64]|uniref:hypothetical protein n=1 Tax=unclassified Streptomyces TaxID=2593676 RepID=UPI0034343B23
MTDSSGDHFTISVGGDANGPIAAGHDIRVEVHHRTRLPPRAEESGTVQENLAKDRSALYTVQEGELHVHHEAPRQE